MKTGKSLRYIIPIDMGTDSNRYEDMLEFKFDREIVIVCSAKKYVLIRNNYWRLRRVMESFLYV